MDDRGGCEWRKKINTSKRKRKREIYTRLGLVYVDDRCDHSKSLTRVKGKMIEVDVFF